jgi:repressor LexA
MGMKKRDTTRTLESVKEKISAFYNNKRRLPSYSEFAKAIGVASKNAVIGWVGKLEEAGIVRRDNNGKLALGANWGQVKILGLVEAGFPSASEEQDLDTTTLDDYLIENRSATYMLRVKGDSMIDAGIRLAT